MVAGNHHFYRMPVFTSGSQALSMNKVYSGLGKLVDQDQKEEEGRILTFWRITQYRT